MKLRDIHTFLLGTMRGRLIISVAIVHAIMMTLFIIDLTGRQRSMLLERQVEEATALAQSLSTSAAVWIASDDLAGLQELVETQRRYPELIFAMLADKEGRILAHTDISKKGQFLQDLPNTVHETVLSKTPMLADIAVPSLLANRHVGWARVGIGQKAAGKKLEEITFNGALYALGAIVIGSFIAWLMGSRITSRLYAVQDTINKVRTGNRMARSSITGSDEAASIAGEFNAMLDILEERNQALIRKEEESRSLLRNIHAGVVVHGPDTRIIRSNPMAQELLGLTEEQMSGKAAIDPAWHFLREDGSVMPLDEYPINQALAGQRPVSNMIVGVKRSDRADNRWALVNADLMRNACGAISEVIVTFIDIAERKRMEEERRANLRFFESMDKVNLAIQGSSDVDGMMNNVLGVVLSVFACDRAYIVYPCDPEAAAYRVPMERTTSEYPGALAKGMEVPVDEESTRVFRAVMGSDSPVTFGPGSEAALPSHLTRYFGVQSQAAMAVYPKMDKPYMFGVHQCSYPRIWTTEETKLLKEIGRRLADALTMLLSLRDLRTSEERYRMVFENSPVSIWEEDLSEVMVLLNSLKKDGVADCEAYFNEHPETVQRAAQLARIVDVNRAALLLHGASSKEELFAGLVRTFTPESFDTFRQELTCLWNGGTTLARDAVVQTLAGERRDVTVYFSVCPGYEETLSKVIVSLVDITERKKADVALYASQETLSKREAALNDSQRLAHIGSWDWDAVKDVIWWSDEYYRIYGFELHTPPPNYAGHRKAYVTESAARLDAAVKHTMETGEPYEVDLELAHPTPDTRWIVARGEAKRDANGKIWGLRGTAQNITERKNAEHDIQKAKEELERRFKERSLDLEKKNAEVQENQIALMNIVEDLNDKTAELEQANARLHELDQLKSMFIASMSHELRTPLNSIIGFSSIMLNEWTGPVTQEQKDNLSAVLRSGKHLLSLINDVIDVSKIEAGKLEPMSEEFDVRDVIAEALQSFTADIQKKGLRAEVRTDRHTLRCDRRRLLQCLLNLISNAIKYTDEGSIMIAAGPAGETVFEIRVSDTGIGIKLEDMQNLFSPFFRIVSPQRAVVAGTGLGLYLTRKLAQEVLRGDILVSSRFGEGSQFTLTMPASDAGRHS